ncbi:MAG: phosphoenolpyruvate--protein phosphotransferase [Phycisphaerae bacterium]
MISKFGVSASPGVAIGPAVVLDTEEYRIPRRTVTPSDIPKQVAILDDAIEASRQEVADLRMAAARKLGEQTADIFAFHESLVADPKLRRETVELIEKKQYSAAYAFAQIMNARQRAFESVSVEYLKERVRDLFDIEKRVLRHILGRAREDITRLTESVILIAHDITPSQAVTFDPARILGLAVNVGGSTSHMAIIARMLDIPTVVALNDITAHVGGGETVIIDGADGIVLISPDDQTIAKYEAKKVRETATETALREIRDEPAITQDGTQITLWANIELASEVTRSLERGATGIGLYRSEFLFLASDRLPTEEQQFEAFRLAVESSHDQPVVIRTIDLGADKINPAMRFHDEHNPALGLRSLRYCLKHLDLFKTHLRAILRASAYGDIRVMFPMITMLSELRHARATLADVMEDLDEEQIKYRRDIPVGMMIETPAAAMSSAAFSREVDFFSIGTNDLTQYTLAVDRANERVAHLYSPHNPAVLRFIRQIVLSGRRANIPDSLCGEMAGNPVYCLLLLGLGVRNFSMSPKNIPEVKQVIRGTDLETCRKVAKRVMRLESDVQIETLLRDLYKNQTGEWGED